MQDMIRRDAFGYFFHETNRANGLVLDKKSSAPKRSRASRRPQPRRSGVHAESFRGEEHLSRIVDEAQAIVEPL